MSLHRPLAAVAAVLLLVAAPLAALTVTTPNGPSEVFSRGDLVDLIELLRLTGATVAFAPAAGSYGAILDGHEVQFTPGGSLAVVNEQLTSLPGPVRQLDGHVVGSLTTAATLLAPLGWTVRPTSGGAELAPLGSADRLDVAAMRDVAGTVIVVRGTALKPRVVASTGAVTLQFPAPVTLAHPLEPEGEMLGGELRESTLTIRLATGTEVVSTYSLDAPPRFLVRLGTAAPLAPAAGRGEEPHGPIVVLDPGHGGDDQGAKGPGGELEKDITLAVARLLAARLQTSGILARLTRESDETVPLPDRTALANRLHADVFVSIHANASAARGARGAETYYMSADASDAQAAQSAARENAGASGDAVQLILWDLAHVAHLNDSARLARALQVRLNALQGIRDRGIKQAPFVVLTGTTMPAALVETGFLSNPEEATRLTGRAGQEELAGVLAEAIAGFIKNPEPTAAPTP